MTMKSQLMPIWAFTLLIAFGMGTSYRLDLPESEGGFASETTAAQQQARQEQRRLAAITKQCQAERGPNSAVIEQPDGGWRCTDKRGKGNILAVAPI